MPAATYLLSVLLQQPLGFPEVEPDVHLDWNSQALDEAALPQTTSAADAEPDDSSYFGQNDQNHTQAHPSSLIWDSEGLVPCLQLPVLKHRNHPPSLPCGGFLTPSLPCDMPTGPSIASARVRHPLSSTESAALTHLRAELNALLVESQNGPDLSLVPLPRQLNQATLRKSRPDATKAAKLVRPKLQPQAPASLVRRVSRRRHTTDAPPSKHPPKVPPAPILQPRQVLSYAESSQPEPCLLEATHPAASQGTESQPAEAQEQASDAVEAAVRGSVVGLGQAVPKSSLFSDQCASSRDGKTLQGPGGGRPRGVRYGRSNTWGPGSTQPSSSTRVGVTQSSTASTSYSK